MNVNERCSIVVVECYLARNSQKNQESIAYAHVHSHAENVDDHTKSRRQINNRNRSFLVEIVCWFFFVCMSVFFVFVFDFSLRDQSIDRLKLACIYAFLCVQGLII
jgi:hypothetical protein